MMMIMMVISKVVMVAESMIEITSEISLKLSQRSLHPPGSKRGPHGSNGEVGSGFGEVFSLSSLFICLFFILPGVGDVFTRSCCGGAELPQGRLEIAQRPRLRERDIVGF